MRDFSFEPSLRSFLEPVSSSPIHVAATEPAAGAPVETASATCGDTFRITPNHGLISPFATHLGAEPIQGSLREKFTTGFAAKSAPARLPYAETVHTHLSTAAERELRRQIRAGERPSIRKVMHAINAEANRLRLPFQQRGLAVRYGFDRLNLEFETGIARLNARIDVNKAKAKARGE